MRPCCFPPTRWQRIRGITDTGGYKLIEKTVTIQNENGLDMQTAARIAENASQFSADIFLLQGQMKANAKSIMGVMMLAARPSSELILIVNGEDELAALKQIEILLNSAFDKTHPIS